MSYETEVAALTVAVNTLSSLAQTLDTTTQSAYNIAVATAQTHAVTATNQVALATTQKTLAASSASSAASSAATATTQAGIALTQAQVATAAAVGASNIVLGVSTLYPTVRPNLDLNFANAQTVDPRITFTRASVATRTNSKGLIEVVASGVPRIDFDAVTGVCKGLLIEEQRTNLLLYSEQLDNAAWGKTNCTVTANATIAPDGTLMADKLVENGASGFHLATQFVTPAAGSVTFSVFAKASENSVFAMDVFSGTDGTATVYINLNTKTIGSVVESFVGSVISGIADAGGGWVRCSITVTASNSSTRFGIFLADGASEVLSYTGDGTSGLFIWGAQLEAGASPTSYQSSTETFTGRASTATFYGSNGLIQTASSGVARMNYNPMNLTVAPKLLLEESRVSLLTYSEQFDNAVWVKSGATVTVNAIAAPDGTTTADKLVESAANTLHYMLRATSGLGLANSTFTHSVFVKEGGRSRLKMQFGDNVANVTSVVFDLASGTVVSTAANNANYTNTSGSITSIGAGWYRCAITTTRAGLNTDNDAIIFITNASNNVIYTGDGVSGVHLWGAQLEAGAFPTSYIPTVASQVTRVADSSTSAQTTRAADVASMTGANFSSWYRQEEGSFVANLSSWSAPTRNAVLLSANDGAGAVNLMDITHQTDEQLVFRVRAASATIFNGLGFSASDGVTRTVAFAYKSGSNAYTKDGAAVAGNSAAFTPSTPLSILSIGGNHVGGDLINGHIRSISYYPKRLTNTELQALSTQ